MLDNFNHFISSCHTRAKAILLTCVLGITVCSALSAQEICNNGIDDDADGAIDLNDTDCACNVEEESIIADFETLDCCPDLFTLPYETNQGIYCLGDGWVSATTATPDLFHQCGFLGESGVDINRPRPPMPFPSGEGVAGFGSSATLGGYSEYIGTCLDRPLIPGEEYELNFDIGFNSSDALTSGLNVEITLYGTSSCANFPSPIQTCLADDRNWFEIGTYTIQSSVDNSWVAFNTTIIATQQVQAIAFGHSCDFTANSVEILGKYHFIDDIEFVGSFDNTPSSSVQIELTGDCANGYLLEANTDDAVTYQWYLDGIAIVGETSDTYTPDPTVTGEYQVVIEDGSTCIVSESLAFNGSEDLFVTEALENVSCFGLNDGSISLDVDGGTPPYEFLWGDGEMTASIDDLFPGSYTVTVTDDAGCEVVASYSIIEPDEIVIEIESLNPPTTSQNGSVLISISGGTEPYEISWDDELIQSTLLADALGFGTYTVTVTDANGCSTTLTVEFEEEELIIELQESNIDCFGECTGAISANISGGTPPYEIEWSDGQAEVEAVSLCADFYDVTVTDAAGQIAVSGLVEIVSPSVLTLTAQVTDNLDANIANGSIEIDVQGGTEPYVYSWSQGSSAAVISNVSAGEYVVTVSDLNNCEVVQSFNVEDAFDLIKVYIPNAFSPNNDGINDEFQVFSNVEDLIVVDFIIYNRWGGRVFQRTNLSLNQMPFWNGKVNGQKAQTGVYVYAIQLATENGQNISRSGEVTLVE